MASFRPDEITLATGGTPLGCLPEALEGISTDSRSILPGELFVALKGERFDGHDFLPQAFSRGAAGAIVERVPSVLPGKALWKVSDTLKALGDLARFHRSRFSVSVLAVTGSSGKTTTKAMLAHLLSGSREVLATPGTQNNRIGVPLTLLKLESQHRAVVLELGSNRWGEIRRLTEIARPTIGILTNIGPAHLETFGDLKGVLKEKSGIWEGMEKEGPLVLNADDPLLCEAGKTLDRPIVWFSCKGKATRTWPKAHVWAQGISLGPRGSSCLVNGKWGLRLGLPGLHNLANALAALAAVDRVGEPLPEGIERLASMAPLPGRLFLKQIDGCTVIDDSYNANPDSLKAALEVLQGVRCPGRKIAALGDMLELGSQGQELHKQAGEWIAASDLALLVAVGPLSLHLVAAARQAGFPKEASWVFDTAQEAGEFLLGKIRPGDTLLIKGSRRIRMDEILTCFTTSCTR